MTVVTYGRSADSFEPPTSVDEPNTKFEFLESVKISVCEITKCLDSDASVKSAHV